MYAIYCSKLNICKSGPKLELTEVQDGEELFTQMSALKKGLDYLGKC